MVFFKSIMSSVIPTIMFFVAMSMVVTDSNPAALDPSNLNIDAWLVDWDLSSGTDETSQELTKISLFAGYFDHTDKPFISSNGLKWLNNLDNWSETFDGEAPLVYLTLVNDQYSADLHRSVQKDSQLLDRLLSTPQERLKHINDILNLLQSDMGIKVDGIDIDYEKIQDFDSFNLFIRELAPKLEFINKRLRVVVEYHKLERHEYLGGVDYVVMAYNKHNSTTAPGPKCDADFISSISKNVNKLIKRPGIAIPTGGFDWGDDGSCIALTYEKCTDLLARHKQRVTRDPHSGYLYFNYTEGQIDHEVWYADNITIVQLMREAKHNGFPDVSVWRLGGNGVNSAVWANNLRSELLRELTLIGLDIPSMR